VSSKILTLWKKASLNAKLGGSEGRSGLFDDGKDILLLPGCEPSFQLPYILDIRTSLSQTSAALVYRARWNRLLSEEDRMTSRCSVGDFVCLFVCLSVCLFVGFRCKCRMSPLVLATLLVTKYGWHGPAVCDSCPLNLQENSIWKPDPLKPSSYCMYHQV
jgi:hypothetical protein